MSKGITLIELMAVTVVLGVLAILGIPLYRATIERGYCRQAHDLLLAIYTGERLHLSREGSYLARGTGVTEDWHPLNLDNPNKSPTSPTRFSVGTSCGVDCFLATATHAVSGETWLTVDQNRAFASPNGRCDLL